MSFVRGCVVALVVAGLSSCVVETHFPGEPPCKGSNCLGSAAAGSTPTTSSGGVGGNTSTSTGTAAGTGTVLGTVHRITNPAFTDSGTSFTGAATVLALSSAISSPYGGAAGTTFTLNGVPNGVTWFQVEDASGGGAGIFSTFSQLTLPAGASVALPVIDSGMMTNITSNLPSLAAKGVSPLASHIVLLLQHLTVPYQGVSVTGGSGSAQIVYDQGPGNYTDSGTKTGSAGTVILFNSALQGTAVIFVTDTTTMTQYSVSVQAGLGAVTLVTASL